MGTVGRIRTLERADILQGYGTSTKDPAIKINEMKMCYNVEIRVLMPSED